MSNINRDYLCILDVKTGAINAPKMYFYNTDRSTSNIYVQLVVKETIVNATPIENATDFVIEAKIVKPNGFVKEMTGQLVNEADAIYEFDLPEDFTDLTGINLVEFWVRARVSDREERITSASTKYTVKGSILNSIDDNIKDDNDYPIFLALMERVERLDKEVTEVSLATKALNEEAKGELAKIKADEVEIANNEAIRQEQEATRATNEEARKTEELRRKANETARGEAETARESAEASRIAYENRRESQERDRVSNEYDRQNAEQSREYAEIDRVANEEIRQTNEANRETAEQIRRTNEQARITAETARVTEHNQMKTEIAEVKAENAILMENDKKIADRMTQVEISDKRQYVIMEGLMNSAGDGYLKIEDTGNDTTLYNSVEGFVDVKNITGNTMVNSIKNPDDELTLNADINTSGQSVTLTTAVDNGQVDVLAEGNTMVNVCDQQEAIAITKSYTVETGNHVALKGEYDGKARPVVQGNTLVNLISDNYTMNGCTYSNNNFTLDLSNSGYVECKFNLVYNVKPSTDYTCVFNIIQNDSKVTVGGTGSNELGVFSSNISSTGLKVLKITTSDSIVDGNKLSFWSYAGDVESGSIIFSKPILLEGDYTNKPIPDYFEGMQSSFEDKVVTQEMVDSGKELAENLGKYRVDYKVTGKNKFNGTYISDTSIGKDGIVYGYPKGGRHTTNFIKVAPNTSYIGFTRGYRICYYDYNKQFLGYEDYDSNAITTSTGCEYLRYSFPDESLSILQIEEGSTATAYEPYKESIKTYYLNSPLLEDDTIEDYGNNVVHVHRRGEYILNDKTQWLQAGEVSGDVQCYYAIDNNTQQDKAYCEGIELVPYGHYENKTCFMKGQGTFIVAVKNELLKSPDLEGFKDYLKNNPIKVVAKYHNDTTYELISQSDTILTDSYVSGHLDFDTAVPVEKVKFERWAMQRKLKYLYPNTTYTVQFESDNIGILKNAYLGSDMKQNTLPNVVKGVNKFNFTLTSTQADTYPYFSFDGIGFNASNIVVTEATDKDFGYFQGMKSVGELEENKIEILSNNSNLVTGMEIGSYSENGEKLNGDSYAHARCTEPIYIGDGGTFYAWMDKNGINDIGASGVFYYALDKNKKVVRSFNGYEERHALKKGEVYIIFRTHMNYDRYNREFKMMISTSPIIKYIKPQSNKKQILLNEPLRAVGDTKDRFIQIDGKWYVERNTAKVVLNGSENWLTTGNWVHENSTPYYIPRNYYPNAFVGKVLNNNFKPLEAGVIGDVDEIGICGCTTSAFIGFRVNTSYTTDSWKQYLQNNPQTVLYQLASPTYEPVEIAPTVNTYSEVTHITNNSTIPMNMPIKNSGYEIIAKPNTKYTVVGIDNGRIGDSTIVNGTITTPATITDNYLRPYGTGKTSKVMLLEGEPANIPGYFKGIKSVFEDKVTEDGKYAVEVKVIGKNKFDGELELGTISGETGENINYNQELRSKNYSIIPNIPFTISMYPNTNGYIGLRYYDKNYKYLGSSNGVKNGSVIGVGEHEVPKGTYYIRFKYISTDLSIKFQLEEGTVATEYEPYHEAKQTLYLDEPLYNANNITIYNDKLGYWKNWDKVVLDGSEDKTIDTNKTLDKNIEYRIYSYPKITENAVVISDKFINKKSGNFERIAMGNVNNDYSRIYITISKAKLQTQDVTGFKQWLSQNPVTVVYQLAEPVFVPLIDNCPNWVIGSWDNCSIHFDSIIPLKDTRYRYTGNVPSVMAMSEDVATVSDISDQQDSMIIDLATQVATMEMMLM